MVAGLSSMVPRDPCIMGAGTVPLTCYYYRGAYYKAFWADPPSCAVSEPRKKYLGENSFPLIIQNVHRYFMYIALLFIVFLTIDVWKALWFINPLTGTKSFGIGIGTLVLALNVFLLSVIHSVVIPFATRGRIYGSTFGKTRTVDDVSLCNLPQ
jgi:heme A synthase